MRCIVGLSLRVLPLPGQVLILFLVTFLVAAGGLSVVSVVFGYSQRWTYSVNRSVDPAYSIRYHLAILPFHATNNTFHNKMIPQCSPRSPKLVLGLRMRRLSSQEMAKVMRDRGS